MTAPEVTGDSADVEQLKRIESELLIVLMRFRQSTEAAILICALMRCARALLNQYEGNLKLVLRNYASDFIKEKRLPSDDPASKLLLLH